MQSTLPERALAAAQELLGIRGDEGDVTMRGIARRCGVSAPSLYEHFSGIEQIRAEAIDSTYGLFEAATKPPPDADQDPRRALQTYVRNYVTFARTHPGLYRTLMNRGNATTATRVYEPASQLFVTLVGLLARARGSDPNEPRLLSLVNSAWLEAHGIACLPVSHPVYEWPSDDELVDALVERAVRTPMI